MLPHGHSHGLRTSEVRESGTGHSGRGEGSEAEASERGNRRGEAWVPAGSYPPTGASWGSALPNSSLDFGWMPSVLCTLGSPETLGRQPLKQEAVTPCPGFGSLGPSGGGEAGISCGL